ncbi:MAG: rRNA (guanine-N2)-methyltransferase [Nitrospinaceae bacterium]|nr:MAG: rRNA (guanine-N2)-methyltransferase [Nitrospinaceae bacterium]
MKVVKLQVSKTVQDKILKGYPWVFDYQVQNSPSGGKPGDLGVIYNSKNKLLALGLYDPFSEIRLRILQTGSSREIDAAFFAERLKKAIVHRSSLEEEGTSGYRVVNGENDGFPGMVLDRYEDTAVMKFYTAAWVPFLNPLLALLQEHLSVERCVLRLSRNTQNLVEETSAYREGQIVFGPPLTSPVCFRENGLYFEVDVLQGQKTGFFLDQRENRQHIRMRSKDKSVLNVFSYTGGFSVYAFAGGARSVWEIDSSPHALKTSREIFALNFPHRQAETDSFQQIQEDAFLVLKQLISSKKTFDLVILDPPALAVKKKQKSKALDTYRRLAESGARLTSSNGLLFAASCSRHVSAKDFFREVEQGVKSAGKLYEEIQRTGHAVDHPVSFREGEYLKGIYLKISGGKRKGTYR